MSTPWVPTKPKSRNWKFAARVDGAILMTDGYCIVRIDDTLSPIDTRHVAKVLGDGAAMSLLYTDAWASHGSRLSDVIVSMLRGQWRDNIGMDSPGAAGKVIDPDEWHHITVTDWCRWIVMQDVPTLLRMVTAGSHLITVDNAFIELVTSPKVVAGQLRFTQRVNAPTSAIVVWSGSAPLGGFLPIVSPNGNAFAGLDDLASAARP